MSELDPSSGEIESQASSVAEDSCELSQLPAIGEKRRCGIEWHRSPQSIDPRSMASAGPPTPWGAIGGLVLLDVRRRDTCVCH